MAATEHISNTAPQTANVSVVTDQELSPLSFAQERLWFLDQLQPGNPAYNIPQGWQLEGEFNVRSFASALNEVIRRHETLRTTFSEVEGKPVEIISAFQPVTLTVTDLSQFPNAEAEARRLMDESARHPFDLAEGPLFKCYLFRLSIRQHLVLFNLHHIIADAWSFEILRREVTAVYEAICADAPFELPELPIQYLDYARWQREQADNETLRNDLEFWKQQFAGELPRLELPFACPIQKPNLNSGSEPFELSPELTQALKGLAREQGATLFTVLLAAFNTFLHRMTGQDDLVIGTPVSGRSQTETEGVIGMFVNTIALRTRIGGDPTFSDLLASVRETTFNAFAHQEMPFEQIVKSLQPERSLGENPLFRIVMALHGGYPAHWSMGSLRARILEIETHTAKFDWTFLLEETGDGLKGRLEYRTGLFEPDAIRRILGYFHFLLEGLAENPERKISELPLLPVAEQEQLLVNWNHGITDFESDACIHQLFEAQVDKTPEAVALVSKDRQITYRELNQQANQLARHLQKCGVAAESLVGLCLNRSPEMIVALLAILKAGGAYVPLDCTYPRERLLFMIEDAALTVLVTDSQSDLDDLPHHPLRMIRLNQEHSWAAEPSSNLPNQCTTESLAYVSYTSGSTGTPKGTLIPHRAVVRLVRHPDYVSISPSDVFLQLAPVSFDASTFEIWGCLVNGARMVLFPPYVPSLEELGRIIEQHQVTLLWLTSGLFHQMADHQLAHLQSVRQLLAGGDVLSVPHILKTIRALPDCQLINGYGPTENTTFTCCYHIPPDWAGGSSVPIGRPISHTQVYILDDHGSPLPIGAVGELFIAGDGVARGYLNQPELTREKFFPAQILSHLSRNPVLTAKGIRINRLYRTGDLVRWLPDGNIEFLGRKDQQVKIRGFRVEPGEIEAALLQHPAIQEAAVVARLSSTNERELVAYITLHSGCSFDERNLREFLKSKIPAYMMPTHIINLNTLPLTSNGKVDHRALPVPEANARRTPQSSMAPRNITEATLSKIWEEVLGHNSFGIHESFFHLGGHSLLATQMISRIARTLAVELPVRTIFETPTIAGLAEQIQATPPVNSGIGIVSRRTQRAEAHRLLAQIDKLSEGEIDSLLSRID